VLRRPNRIQNPSQTRIPHGHIERNVVAAGADAVGSLKFSSGESNGNQTSDQEPGYAVT
jgi:hypothetical protein